MEPLTKSQKARQDAERAKTENKLRVRERKEATDPLRLLKRLVACPERKDLLMAVPLGSVDPTAHTCAEFLSLVERGTGLKVTDTSTFQDSKMVKPTIDLVVKFNLKAKELKKLISALKAD